MLFLIYKLHVLLTHSIYLFKLIIICTIRVDLYLRILHNHWLVNDLEYILLLLLLLLLLLFHTLRSIILLFNNHFFIVFFLILILVIEIKLLLLVILLFIKVNFRNLFSSYIRIY